MEPSPWDRPATLSTLRQLTAHGVLSPQTSQRAAALLGAPPSATEWLRQGRLHLLWLGALLCVCGVIFFIAANWDGLHPYARLALMAATIAGASAVAWRQQDGSVAQAAAVAVCALLWGPMLALYGQAYQTGADAWGLFAAWALLVTPYAVLSRGGLLWVIWTWLLQLAFYFYLDQVLMEHDEVLLRLVCTAADVALVAGLERLAANPWVVRTVVLKAQAWVLVLGLAFIIEDHHHQVLDILLALATTAACWFVYRNTRRDLFLVAVAAASTVALASAVVIRVSKEFHLEVFALFLDGAAILVLVGVAVQYLRALHSHPDFAQRGDA